MPNTLHEKALKEPFRVGLMLGALALPTLWVVSQDALRLLIGEPLLRADEITRLYALGFLPGMILGAGALRAWVAWRAGESGEARWMLMGHSGLVVTISLGILLNQLWKIWQLKSVAPLTAQDVQLFKISRTALAFYFNLPLQVALFMLLLGIFLRSPRR